MKFSLFKQRVRRLPIFSVSHISAMTKDRKLLLNQLVQWRREGKVNRLKRGLYTLGSQEGGIPLSRLLVANQLLSPSYVSLEYALSFYGLIPEKAEEVTSVTTHKTSVFKNNLGVFRYQHIKATGFKGFLQISDENRFPIWIAEREKALVDLFYLNLDVIPQGSPEGLIEFYRLGNLGDLRRKKLVRYAALFSNRRLKQLIERFCQHIEKIKA